MQSRADGLDRQIKLVRALVALNFRFRDLCDHLDIVPCMGILLCGPTGASASFLAEALTNDIRATLYDIQGSEVTRQGYGESEWILRDVFAEAEKNAPAIVLIDGIDFIAPSRQKSIREGMGKGLLATLLALMDRIRSSRGVIVIGTTNSIKDIDPVLRQPGRFEEEICIGDAN